MKYANVYEAAEHAKQMMNDCGHPVPEDVEVNVDEKLSFMGYSSQRHGRHFVVVAGHALKAPTLMGLLLHEFSHISRIITNHPSHNAQLTAEVVERLAEKHNLYQDWQQEIFHQITNSIMDLYADNLVMDVFHKHKTELFPIEQFGEFFMGWVHEPVNGATPNANWKAAAVLLTNAFAISNMQRHKLPGSEKAEVMNKKFMAKIPPEAARGFDYFNKFMKNLKEDVTETQFRKQINDYLENFLAVAENM